MYILKLEQRQRELRKWEKSLSNAPLPHEFNTSFECWLEYRDTGVLPFAGNWLEQPQWLLDDFSYYDLLKEYRSLPQQIGEAKRDRERVMKQ